MLSIWPLILAATAGVALGTAIGTPILQRLPARGFRWILSVLLIGLGAYMALSGGGSAK